MKPDRHGYIRVFVGGKYGEWNVVGGDSDEIVLRGSWPTAAQHPGQLSLDDDPEIELKDLGQRRPI